jgi:hypothetical protein
MEANQTCAHDHCGKCCAGGCAGCTGVQQLTEEECGFLLRFAELPFLPAAAKQEAGPPVFLTGSGEKEVLPETISSLANRGLIRVDYDIPLLNYDYVEYRAYPLHGSMALTVRGQEVIKLLEIQGLEEEREC